ncbi:piggyBac transposable element-derived protein 2-like [Schistocerca serialis cubense]|uniref:piggyBac transposable element-derived protein 2-like n=1 Tax=Schistocerca serialis cubense TaxID=2023355 RepID=UPI00214F0C78|nr:piggyBac transposable element-derived protein 2-like [Schistocerca serialis cubense]
MSYFSECYPEDFIQLASDCSNSYYFSKKGKLLHTNPQEIKKLYGMHVLVRCIRYPRTRMYWQKSLRMPTIADCMPRDRFFTLRTATHVVDTNNIPRESETNRVWKVHPEINVVRSACLRLPCASENDYSIDEQMVSFTGRCTLSQYVPNKPRPLGIKNFVLATTKGLVLDFEFYQGKSTPLPDFGLGLGPSVILRPAQSLSQGARLYFDRYFTALPLLQHLLELGLEGTGTIMKN